MFFSAMAKVSMSSKDLGPSAVVAPGHCGDLAFEGLLPDVVALDLPGGGEHGEEPGGCLD
ncbi:hypothetical protein ACWD0A_00280 [Streptomyces sp. NPDC002867]